MGRILDKNLELMKPAIAAMEDNQKKRNASKSERREAWKSTFQNYELAASWAAHRKEVFNLTVLPDLIASELFEIISLEKGQRIEIDTTYNAEYQVKEINQMGGMVHNSWVMPNTVNMRDVYEIETEEVAYPVESIIQGNIDKSDEVNRDVRFAYENKIDLDVWTLFTSIFDTFTTNATYRLHSRVDSGNLPTTNIVDASAEGGLTVGAMKQLLAHCELAGITPRLIYLSPQDKPDIWDWTTVVAGYTGTTPTPQDVLSLEKHAELWKSGKITNMFGYPVIFKTLNFLAPGKVYVASDKPSGKLYFKPDYERVIFYTQNECRKLMKLPRHEAVGIEGVIKPLIEAPQYLNSVRLDIA